MQFVRTIKIKLSKCVLLTPSTSVWKAVPKPLASVFWGNIYNTCWSVEWERLILKNRLTKKENYFWLANFSPLATVCGHSTLQGFSFIMCIYFSCFFFQTFFFFYILKWAKRLYTECLEMVVAFFFFYQLAFYFPQCCRYQVEQNWRFSIMILFDLLQINLQT